MHIANYCASDIEHTEILNIVKSVKYHLNKFLSISAWSSFSSLIISAEKKQLSDDLNFIVVLFSSSRNVAFTQNKITYFHMHIIVSEFVIPLFHYVVGYQVVQSSSCKEYVKSYSSWLLSYITVHFYQLWISKEHIILNCIIFTIIKKKSHQYWVSSSACLTKVRSEQYLCFSLENS